MDQNSTTQSRMSSVDAAAQFGVTNDYLTQLCRKGMLAGTRRERVWFVDPTEVAAFLEDSRLRKETQRKSLSEHLQKEYKRSATPTAFAPVKTSAFAAAMGASLLIGVAVFGASSSLGAVVQGHMPLQMSAAATDNNSELVSSVASSFVGFIQTIFALFAPNTNIAVAPVSDTQQPGVVTPAATSSTYYAANQSPEPARTLTTVVNNTYPVIERTVVETHVQSGVTRGYLDAQIARIQDNLSGRTGGSSVSFSDLTASDIPDLSGVYLPLAGGTVTGTTTTAGLVVSTLDCSGLGNGGKLTTDSGGNVVCDNDNGSGGVAWGSITGTLSGQSDLQTALNAKLDVSSFNALDKGYFFSTTSANYLLGTKNFSTFAYPFPSNATSTQITFSGGIVGNVAGNVTGTVSGNAGTVTNGVYTTTFNSLFDSRFITSLAATSSVASITTLPSLVLPYSQLTGTPGAAGYPFPSNATSTSIAFNGGLTANTAAITYASTTAISATTLCLATDCRTLWPTGGGGSAFNYPFPSDATSTQIAFNGGLTAYASTTIGNGLTGLTINGPATTTGAAYFAGTVGVGVTEPGAALQVDADGGYGQIEVSNIANTDHFGGIGIEGANDQIITGATKGDLSLWVSGGNINFSASAGSTDQLVVSESGNVGIGTTSPFATLSVAGNGYFGGTIVATGDATIGGSALVTGNINAGSLEINGSTRLDTSLNGLLKAASGIVSQAVAGTDYLTSAWTSDVDAANHSLSRIDTLTFYNDATKLQNVTDTYNTQGLRIIDGLSPSNRADLFPYYRDGGAAFQTGDLLIASSSGAYYAAPLSSLGLSNFAYLFPSNATSTQIAFNGGLYVGGNLGVGVNSPADQIEAYNDSGPTVISALNNNNGGGINAYSALSAKARDAFSAAGAWGSNLVLDNTSDPSLAKKVQSLSGWGIIGYNQSSAWEDQDSFHIDYANSDGTATTTRLAINYLGNVGIGTALPTSRLSVAGDANIVGNFSVGADTTLNTSFSGVLKATAGLVSVATPGTDYVADTSGDWQGTFDGQSSSYYLDASNLSNFDGPFDTAFGAKSSDDLAEGLTNSYYHDSLARGALVGGDGIDYDAINGTITNTGVLDTLGDWDGTFGGFDSSYYL
ncbi:MAG TPA: polymer-forming cytoskeletal protein, partial [Candidatus Paceibacterota bacterium]|nr:polymer-forming cytoskeletal protein [Candidatus Paceibacterota bacterium]